MNIQKRNSQDNFDSSKKNGYWSVVIIQENPFVPREQSLKLFLYLSQSFNPLETEIEQPLIGSWTVKCKFILLEEASHLCEHWKKNNSISNNSFFVGAWDKNCFIDIWSNPEKRIQFQLHQKLGGRKEVVTPIGNIDLLTDTEIIEIKLFSNWKSALGQVLVYGKFYPNHQKHLYLFARQVPKKLDLIKDTCISYDVIIDLEIDQGWRYEQ